MKFIKIASNSLTKEKLRIKEMVTRVLSDIKVRDLIILFGEEGARQEIERTINQYSKLPINERNLTSEEVFEARSFLKQELTNALKLF